MADNVSGIVLEIPSTVLDNIKKAGKEIATLEEISKRAAQKIEGHFSKQMVNGVQKFIDKVIEAQGKLGTLNVNVNIKDNGLSSLLQQLSQALPTINSMSGGIHNIGKESQSAALNLANVSEQIKAAFPYTAKQNIDQLKTSIEAINNKLRDKKGGVSRPEDERFLVNLKDRYTQELKVLETSDRKRDENFQKEQARAAKEAEQHNAKMRRKNEEYHATQKQIALEDAARKKAVDSFTRKTDTQILSEQNKLLNERATLLKNIGNLEALKAKNTTLGNAPLNKDQADLMTAYKSRIDAVDKRLADIAAKYDILSEKGKKAYDTRDLQSYNKWQEINLRNEEKIGKARERAKSLLESSGKKSLQPSSEELTAQRKLESIYSRKLAIEKEIQAIQDRRKLSGTSQSAAETQYLNTLINQARTLKSEARTTAEGFEKINKAVKGDYVEKRLQMQARAAYDLAIAQEKVNREMSKEKPKPAGYQDTTKQVENVRLLQQMYNTLNAELNTLQNKRIQIRAEIDKKYEGQLNDLNKRIADFQKKMASPTSTTKTRGYLSAEIDKLKAKIDEINATKITLKTSTGLDTSIAKVKSELASIATESAKAQKELASTTNANNALERQERKITSLRDKITALDVEIAKLNAKGQLKDSTGGLTAEGTRLIQRRIDLTAELEKKTQTAAQAQQASIAADKQKAEVYKRLTAEQDKLSASMKKAVEANKGQLPTVGTTERTAYDKLESQRIANEQRMTQIAQQNIKEVNEFRLQRELKTQQDILSAFIQSEAQKKQIALQTVKDESDARAQAYSRYTQTYEGAMKYATKDSRTDTYQKREVAIKKLEAAIKNLSTADANYTAKQQNLITQLNRLKSAQEGVNVAMSKKPVQADTSKAAMDAAKNAKSLNDLKAAYERLKAIMDATKPKTPEWNAMNTTLQQTKGKIDSIRTSMGELKKQSNGLDNMFGQLKNRIAAAFSVAAITGFVKKLIDARAQMELQQVALRAILQDKQVADKIYSEVQQMALQSPFSIKDMTTFTKQLAAYRIESEKLVGTTKMLADVSAGLGVDMQRLILAYGQVKSANYLRATEVRQFTEAGLNIGGELAQYYSEVEKKMVSVGDVMDRISKRMVKFEDVETVFKRVTAAGGIFYDMQKKQSETLHGQMQRIQDAMTMMFNEIGKSNQGTISWMLKSIRSLINHWRELAPVVKTAGWALLAYFAAFKVVPGIIAGLKAVSLSMVVVTAETKKAAAAQKLLGATNPYGVLMVAAAALLSIIYELATAQSALNEEFSRISEEASKDMWDLIYKYEKDADTIRDVTSSYQEREAALKDLQDTFKGVLPDQMLEYKNIIKMSDGYKEATEAIRLYAAEKAKEAAQSAIEEEKAKKYNELVDTAKELYKVVRNSFDSLKGAPDAAIRGIIGNIMDEIKAETEKGMIKSAEDGYNRFIQILEQRFGTMNEGRIADILKDRVGKLFGTVSYGYIKDPSFKEYLTYMTDQQEEYENRYMEWLDNMNYADLQRLETEKENYEKRSKMLTDLKTSIETYRNLENSGDLRYSTGILTPRGKEAETDLESKLKAVSAYREEIGLAKLSMDELKAATQSEVEILSWLDSVQQSTLGGFLDNLLKVESNNSIKRWATKTREDLKNAGFSETQIAIIETMKKLAKAQGVSISMFDKLKISGQSSFQSVSKDAKALSEECAQNILQIEKVRAELLLNGYAANEALKEAERRVGMTLEFAQQGVKLFRSFWYSTGAYDYTPPKVKKKKEPKTKQTKEVDVWTPRLELMKKINKEYKKLIELEDAYTSKDKIVNAYKDAVAKTFKGTAWADINSWWGFDDEATMNMIEDIATKAGDKYKDKFLEAAGTYRAELDFETLNKQLEEAKEVIQEQFDNYDLTLTFKKLGVDPNLVSIVGGVPTDLDDLEKYFTDWIAEYKKYGGMTKYVKANEEALEKVRKLRHKSEVERLKNYNKYLLESMSERVQIELKAEQEIQKIKENIDLDDFSKEQAISQVYKKMNDDLAKFDFNQLKGTDVYIQTFKDLEKASKDQLSYVILQLESLQKVNEDLSPSEVKAIIEDLRKAEEEFGKRSAISDLGKNFVNSLDYMKKRSDLLREQVRLAGELESTELERDDAQKRYYELLRDVELLQVESLSEEDQSKEYKKAKEELEKTKKILEWLDFEIYKIKESQRENNDEIRKGEQAWKNFQGALAKASEWIDIIKESVGSIFEGLDSMGLVSDSTRDAFDSFSEIMDGIDKTLDGLESIDITKPFSIITGSVKAIGGIFSTIGGFIGIGDKKKERDIQKLQKKVENLEKAYERLGKAIEEAYTYNDYNLGYNQAMKNLEEQRKAINEQMALEKAKKKTDKDKLREYEDSLNELAEKEEELRKQRYEAYGSYSADKVFDEAQNFVSAWLDAYKETGDGLDALNEHWDEFLENLVLKQAASAVVSKRMAKYIDLINDAIDRGGTGLSLAQTFAQIGANLKAELGTWNEDLKAFFDAVGITGGQGELLLSDLQKGIQNITEPQAAAIEAYLNSMRFAVFEQNNILTEMLTAIQSQYGGTTDSPILNEVKAIRSIVASIDDRLSRVIVSRTSSNTTYAVKIV